MGKLDGPIDPEKIFETSDIDLGAFLMMEGVRYLGSRPDFDPNRRRPIGMMRFLDEKSNIRDLERLFVTSPEKKYRELTKYLLKEVHQEIKRNYPQYKERD